MLTCIMLKENKSIHTAIRNQRRRFQHMIKEQTKKGHGNLG